MSPIPTTLGPTWLEVLIPKGYKVLPRKNDENPIELQAMVETRALRLFVPRDCRKGGIIILTGIIDNNHQEVVGFLLHSGIREEYVWHLVIHLGVCCYSLVQL